MMKNYHSDRVPIWDSGKVQFLIIKMWKSVCVPIRDRGKVSRVPIWDKEGKRNEAEERKAQIKQSVSDKEDYDHGYPKNLVMVHGGIHFLTRCYRDFKANR